MNSSNAAISTGRRHDIDALRVIAFGLLILYHVGMFYVLDWDWHVKSAYQSETLQTLMLLVNQWRMPLIFIISGIAVNFLFGKLTAGAFAWSRMKRLLVPLLFGMAAIVPPQAYLQAIYNNAFRGSYGEFLLAYFSFQPWPEGAFSGSEIGITWNHLWYLPYLLVYTLALIPAARWLEGRGKAWRDRMLNMRGAWPVLLPIVPLVVYGKFIFPLSPGITHALFDDFYGHAMYFTFFFYGYLLGNNAGIWRELARLRRFTLPTAIASFVMLVTLFEILPSETTAFADTVRMFVIYLNRWLWLLAVLGWGHHLLNRPFGWLPYATEAVYPWYILHQTFTVVIGFQLSKLALGPVIEPALVLGGTVAGCLLAHEFIIRRTAILRPLFGLKPARNTTHTIARGEVDLHQHKEGA